MMHNPLLEDRSPADNAAEIVGIVREWAELWLRERPRNSLDPANAELLGPIEWLADATGLSIRRLRGIVYKNSVPSVSEADAILVALDKHYLVGIEGRPDLINIWRWIALNLSALPEPYQQVFRARYGFLESGEIWTLERCAKAMGMGRERVRKIERVATHMMVHLCSRPSSHATVDLTASMNGQGR